VLLGVFEAGETVALVISVGYTDVVGVLPVVVVPVPVVPVPVVPVAVPVFVFVTTPVDETPKL
jgi:hypothetical protein